MNRPNIDYLLFIEMYIDWIDLEAWEKMNGSEYRIQLKCV